MPDLVGKSLGRYHIIEQLGEGGMATVYKAFDTRLERDVAVKVIRVDQFAPAVLERILKRFEREAKALARLIHPNIVHVNDYGEQDGVPYLVMDYLPGGTLKQRLGKAMPWQEAIKLLLPVAEALDYAHSQGIIHRDVKPSNILLTQSGKPMLTDFGIAKLLESEETQTLTGTGAGVGTPEYMAPEQTGRIIDRRVDIYALGIVLYEMLTGRRPYEADTPLAVLIKQASEPLPRPGQFAPGIPEDVVKVLLKALAKNPEDRYPNMTGLVKAFENLLSQPSIGRGKGKGRKGEARGTQPPATPDSRGMIGLNVPGVTLLQEEPTPPQNKTWRSWVLGAGCLVFVGVLVMVITLFGEEIQVAFSPTRTPTSPSISLITATRSITPTFTPSCTFTTTPTASLTPIPAGYAIVPDVIGMKLSEAEQILHDLGFSITRLWILGSKYDPGRIDHFENVSAGDIVSTNTVIVLAISSEPVTPTAVDNGGSPGTSLCPQGYEVRNDYPPVNPACVLVLGAENLYPDKVQACTDASSLVLVFPNWLAPGYPLECYYYPP